MTNVGADHLLLGVLALRMDLIGPDALIAAMNTWGLDKTKTLDHILMEQGALNSDSHRLLEALVLQHLQMPGGNPGQSQASVPSLAPTIQALQQVADGDVQTSLAEVTVDLPPTRAPSTDADPYATRAPSATATQLEMPASSGQRFRILRPHARGGLGVVFVAMDEELGREVALKEIQNHHADNPASRARFLLEAEITGRLEHPGIVPVYGLGQHPDGRPYYAMRFIRGDSLKDAIARMHQANRSVREQASELRKLLGRLIDVCNAMAYAHSRGVLHRDLKPDNIMLGKYGETLVVDWGLAKTLDQKEAVQSVEEPSLQRLSRSGSAETLAGSAVGTPQYMSPEQAAGRLDRLGPVSDIYSLGATLYCLLIGQPPVTDQDVGMVLQKVQRGDIPRPRQIKPSVPTPLEAVCLKAMALKPEDRYRSARDLADDLEHWLSDEPVSAYQESWQEHIAGALERSRRDVEFHTWGTMVWIFAVIVLVGDLVLFFLTHRGPPYPLYWVLVVQLLKVGLMGGVFVLYRARAVLPRNSAERGMWSIWLGFLFSCGMVALLANIRRGEAVFDEIENYQFVAVLSGFAFIMLGSEYWGRCFLFGIAFFVLAIVMTLNIHWSSLEFGLMWFASLSIIGWRLRQMGVAGQATEQAS